MLAVRDILNHYILNTAVTFEMVELSLENRKTWFTQFSETGRYQLFVAEEGGEVMGSIRSYKFQSFDYWYNILVHPTTCICPFFGIFMSSIYNHSIHPNFGANTGKGIGDSSYHSIFHPKVYSSQNSLKT